MKQRFWLFLKMEYGKRSQVQDLPVEQSRGGKGVITMKITSKTGNLIALKEVFLTTMIL